VTTQCYTWRQRKGNSWRMTRNCRRRNYGGATDRKYTPRTIPTPALQRTPMDVPKIPNEQCLVNCQSVGYMKKREKEGTKK